MYVCMETSIGDVTGVELGDDMCTRCIMNVNGLFHLYEVDWRKSKHEP